MSLVLDARNIVGESIIWSPGEQALYWVDIVGSRISRFDPAKGAHTSWPAPELPTSIGLRRRGGFIVGLRRRVALWSPGSEFQTLAVPEPDLPDNRLNEGAVAPDGSFWVGTMQDNIAADGSPKAMTRDSGAIYRIAPDGVVSQLTDRSFGITNTMLWTDDGSFITADTLRNEFYRYDYAEGALRNRRPFAPRIERGLSDGSAMDGAGSIYNARVAGGAAIAQLTPEGEFDRIIDLPCSSPTSCAFGGPDLSTLYVTSSRFGMSQDQLNANPAEGGLFSLTLDARGRAANLFHG
ncbi:MAG: SMP-30/gluconolactonase/LRE family protein [Devosia sp.]